MTEMDEGIARTAARKAVCTIISKNYLPFARTFTETYLRHNPDEEIYVLLVDRVDGYFAPGMEKFKLIELEDIGIEGLPQMLFKYSVIELNTAVKPFFMEYLFKTFGLDKLIYFDPDIMVLDDIDELWELLDVHSIILTPHLDAPYPDEDKRPNDYDIMQAGVYNLGFIALLNTQKVGQFLRWWQKKLRRYCFIDPLRGYFVDQKWIDLVPWMFERVYILKDVGYNTAHWNLHSRKIARTGSGYTVNGKAAKFFHFSGFKPEYPEYISRPQNRFTLANREDLRSLFEEYRVLMLKNGYMECRKWPYAFSTFDNGVEIHELIRKVYGYLPELVSSGFGNPFVTEDENSFFRWLNEKVGPKDGKGIKRVWCEVFKIRVDAQLYYPEIFAYDWAGFLQWCLSVNEVELHFSKVFLPEETDSATSAEILKLRSEVIEKSRVIEEKSRAFEEKTGAIEALRMEIVGKQEIINNLLDSYSWRVTKPLRWLSARLKGQ